MAAAISGSRRADFQAAGSVTGWLWGTDKEIQYNQLTGWAQTRVPQVNTTG